VIELRAVSKRYRSSDRNAVERLTLTVPAGEIFGFLGPNGAGKTTTIKMIVGLVRPDSGDVLINGVNMWLDPITAKRQLAFVPDTPQVYDKLSGSEYLNFIADMYGVAPADRVRRVERLSALFELRESLRDRIDTYSHGMKQKLTLVSALVHDPAVWVLDEPLIGLDPHAAHALKSLMKEHALRGRSVLFATHVLEVAEKVCHRVAIMCGGQIAASGTVSELRGEQGERSLEEIFLEITAS
jgi:ABC-2 type transport system ATP-binding protein